MENTNKSVKKVLIVEDEKAMAKAMEIKLQKAGITAHAVFSGDEGLLELEKNEYSLVLLDIMMPGMDGWEIMTKIKDRTELDEFNNEVRNPYVHYNIKKLIKDMVLSELQSVNVETGEVTTQENVKPENYPSLWFSAKKVLDKKSAEIRVGFCVIWTNKLFSGNTK